MVVGSDIPTVQSVKWYAAGTLKTETITVVSLDVTHQYLNLAKTADYGSCVVLVNGVQKAHLEKTASAAAPATEALGTNCIVYTTISLNDVVVIQYVDITTSPLVQIGAALDIKTGISADTKIAPIHGQVNKLKVVTSFNQDAQLEQFQYNQTFLALVLGDQQLNSPATNLTKITNQVTGLKKVPAIVGKQYDATYTTVLYKWYLIGAQATGLDISLPAEDMYKDSMKFLIDEYLEVDMVV